MTPNKISESFDFNDYKNIDFNDDELINDISYNAIKEVVDKFVKNPKDFQELMQANSESKLFDNIESYIIGTLDEYFNSHGNINDLIFEILHEADLYYAQHAKNSIPKEMLSSSQLAEKYCMYIVNTQEFGYYAIECRIRESLYERILNINANISKPALYLLFYMLYIDVFDESFFKFILEYDHDENIMCYAHITNPEKASCFTINYKNQIKKYMFDLSDYMVNDVINAIVEGAFEMDFSEEPSDDDDMDYDEFDDLEF